jgi:hypothetical protein
MQDVRWYFQDYLGLNSRIREWDIPEEAGPACHHQGNNQQKLTLLILFSLLYIFLHSM